MADEPLEMPFLRNIGMIMTYRCQVACPHCIIEAGPNRKEQILIEDAFAWIKQIAQHRSGYIKVLSLTGGEPFIDLERLRAVSDFALGAGLFVSAVTNAFWANGEQEAEQVLRNLPALGMIAISCDAYHQASIPFERVKNAVLAAQTLRIPYNLAVCTQNTSDPLFQQLLDRLDEFTPPDTIATAIAFPVGRARKFLNPSDYETSSDPPIAACSAGSSPMIFPDGRVLACIGPVVEINFNHPLMLGDLRNEKLAIILDNAERNSVLHAIRIWGPRKLISMISETALRNKLPSSYIAGSVCNACYSLMSDSKIVEYLRELQEDLSFSEKVQYARAYYLKELSPLPT
jgi:organic radical activating enzyme